MSGVPELPRLLALAALSLLLGPTLSAVEPPPATAILKPIPGPLRPGAAAVREVDLRSWVRFLAAAQLEGRDAGSRGYDVAALFCASVLESHGVAPAGDLVDGTRSYAQKFAIVELEQDREASYVEIDVEGEKHRFEPGKDFSTLLENSVDWIGKVVFVAAGVAPTDVASGPDADRIALVVLPTGQRRLGPDDLQRPAPRRALVVGTADVLSFGRRGRIRRPVYLLEKSAAADGDGIEVVYVSTSLADVILAAAGTDVQSVRDRLARGEACSPRTLDAVSVHVVRKVSSATTLATSNLVGRIAGSGPGGDGEVVVVGAHLDHVGTDDGKVFNGADDNASGVAGVLALARAFATTSHRPRRDVLLVLYGAEEKGLLGSRYFVDHPVVPLDRVFVTLNLDMIGRNEQHGDEKAEENTNSVHVVGSRRRSYQLHDLIVELNRSVGLDLEYDEERVYRRSDQYHFSEAGIPVAFFFTGFHPDYHRETDTVEKLNFSKMVRIVRLTYLVTHALADLDGRLRPVERF